MLLWQTSRMIIAAEQRCFRTGHFEKKDDKRMRMKGNDTYRVQRIHQQNHRSTLKSWFIQHNAWLVLPFCNTSWTHNLRQQRKFVIMVNCTEGCFELAGIICWLYIWLRRTHGDIPDHNNVVDASVLQRTWHKWTAPSCLMMARYLKSCVMECSVIQCMAPDKT